MDGELSRFRLNDVKCFGVDLTPDNVAVAIVYFVQGVLGLAKLAVGFYLKDDLHLDPAEVRSFFFTWINFAVYVLHSSLELCQ